MKTLRATLAFVFFGMAHSINAQPEIASYELGAIPNQTVWSGSSRAFRVVGSGLTLSVSPTPSGSIEFTPETAAQSLFRYTPDVADISPFQVTIAGGGNSQTFTVTPQPDLLPERSYFQTDKHTQPVISTSEASILNATTSLPEELNFQTNFLRNVRIVGDTVEIEAGNKNGIYDAYTDRRDIKSLEIFAEKVVIRSPIRLKQTAVAIHARDLVFEGGGKIVTTPEEKIEPAASDNQVGGYGGDDGLQAGNITLRIANFANLTTNQIVLDLSGGRGQPGGAGRHGSPGKNKTALSPATTASTSDYVPPFGPNIFKTYNAPSGYQILYVHHDALVVDAERGVKDFPDDGTAAKPSGKPGLGGAGGSLTASIAMADVFQLNGGASAEPTLPAVAPFDIYKGGVGGSPRKSVWVFFVSKLLPLPHIEATDTLNVSKDGADAPVLVADAPFGAAGSFQQQSAQFSWVDPLWLRKVLNHIQDDYLANDISAAHDRLEEYATLLAQLQASPEWAAFDVKSQLEFRQISGEIQILLQRINANLDYFGNPAGWTPMLSFEVTKNIFESEIDRAIETLYLAYWIGNIAQTNQQLRDSLSDARDQLRKDIEQARTDYTAAVENLPTLDAKAAALQARIRNTQSSLAYEESILLEDARGPAWVTEVRLGLKVAATICQVVPVYQPALYAVGQGVRVASDFDPSRGWSSITNAQTISMAYTNSPFKSSAETNKVSQGQIDPAKAQTNGLSYITMLQQSSVGLQAGVKDISNFINQQNAPTPEILAKLEELKSKSPKYKKLLDQVENLMEENGKFADEIITTMQRIGILSDVITQDLLAIDALNVEIAPTITVLDERATVYLEEMKRRSLDRLLKYHYYMAKAYEYRLLKPYTQPLNLEGLFLKFEEIAALNPTQEIRPEQFTTLRQVYQSLVADVAESIYDEYVSNRPELSVPIRFNLADEEIATLNAGGVVTLNPYNRGLFPLVHENIRIVDLKVFSMTTEAEGGAYGSTAYVDLTIAHSGISHLKQDGNLLIFRHYNQQTQNPIVWGARYDPIDNQIDSIRPSDASDSLLRSLLSGPATSDMLLYSRPSAWADLQVTRDFLNSNGKKILLKSVRLELVYDFIRRNEGLGLHTLEVVAAGVDLGTAPVAPLGGIKKFSASLAGAATSPTLIESGMQPLFTLDKEDVNDRQHARGDFMRIYSSAAGAVKLTAPATYGEWQFHQWTDAFGSPLPGGADPAILLNMGQDASVIAQYVLPILMPTLELPVSTAGSINLKWSGGSGVFLQSSDTVNGPWQDVSASSGVSTLSVPTGGGTQFFRVVRR